MTTVTYPTDGGLEDGQQEDTVQDLHVPPLKLLLAWIEGRPTYKEREKGTQVVATVTAGQTSAVTNQRVIKEEG